MKVAGAALSVLAVLTVSCNGHKKEADNFSEQTVDVAYPEIDSVTLSNTYPGQLIAVAEVDVVARVNGQLMSQNYKDGDDVRKGQVMFRIEDSKYRDAVQQASAALTTAISSKDYAQSHYEAVKKALENDAVSKMEVNQAETSLRQAEASIKNAQAALETAKTNLGYCTITAPISGSTKSAAMDVGNYINGEGNPVKMTTIYDTSIVTAIFSADSTDDTFLTDSAGNKVALKHIPLVFSDSVRNQYFGDLSYVAPVLESSTGTITLKCHIKNPYGELRPGMFVKVNLPYKTVKNAILVKDASIGTDQLGKYLYVINDSNTVVYTPIEVGPLYHDSLRVVKAGITPKSKYVTKAMLKVREGMKIKPAIVK